MQISDNRLVEILVNDKKLAETIVVSKIDRVCCAKQTKVILEMVEMWRMENGVSKKTDLYGYCQRDHVEYDGCDEVRSVSHGVKNNSDSIFNLWVRVFSTSSGTRKGYWTISNSHSYILRYLST